MKTFRQSKKTIEELMEKNGKKTWWTILAALIVTGIQACGSTWNLRENQINVEVKQNCKNENKRAKKHLASPDEPGIMDNGICSSKQEDGGTVENNRSIE